MPSDLSRSTTEPRLVLRDDGIQTSAEPLSNLIMPSITDDESSSKGTGRWPFGAVCALGAMLLGHGLEACGSHAPRGTHRCISGTACTSSSYLYAYSVYNR